MPSALATYAFLNAKLKARASFFLSMDRIDDLIRAKSLPETMLLLRGGAYGGLEAAYGETGDLRTAEAMLYAAQARIFLELTRWSRGHVREFFLALTLRFEIDNLKNIMRLWFDAFVRGGDVIGKAGYIDRKPMVHRLDVDAMLAATDAREMLAALTGTPYSELAAEHLEGAVARGNLFGFELALDRFYFARAFAAAANLDARDRAIAERALAMDADAQNADRIIRFKTWYGLGADEALAYLIPYGAAAKARGLGESYASGDLSGIAAFSAGGAFGRLGGFLGANAEGKSRGELLRKAFQAIALDEARRLLGGYPFSVGIPLAYATLRREEIRTVIAILNAKFYGLSEERIRDAL